MNRIKKIVDGYLIFALLIDVIVVIGFWLINVYAEQSAFILNNQATNINILSTIIGSSIALAGFVLASLTIIVALRSNVKSKIPENAETPLELFFSIGTYRTIVKVFQIAIIELVICFIGSYIVWIGSCNISNNVLFNFIISFVFIISMGTIRSLFVMFLLIAIDTKANG